MLTNAVSSETKTKEDAENEGKECGIAMTKRATDVDTLQLALNALDQHILEGKNEINQDRANGERMGFWLPHNQLDGYEEVVLAFFGAAKAAIQSHLEEIENHYMKE